MKLQVRITFWNGMPEPGDPEEIPDYDIVDADTGRLLTDKPFKSYKELEAHIASHYPDCERWVPPLAPPEHLKGMVKLLDFMDKTDLDLNFAKFRMTMIHDFYNYSFPDEIAARMNDFITRYQFWRTL